MNFSTRLCYLDPCPDPIELTDENGNLLKTLCFSETYLDFDQHREECTSLGGRLLEINSDAVLLAFRNYMESIGFFGTVPLGGWIVLNGKTNSQGQWEVFDPSGPWEYRSGVQAVAGSCAYFLAMPPGEELFEHFCHLHITPAYCEF